MPRARSRAAGTRQRQSTHQSSVPTPASGSSTLSRGRGKGRSRGRRGRKSSLSNDQDAVAPPKTNSTSGRKRVSEQALPSGNASTPRKRPRSASAATDDVLISDVVKGIEKLNASDKKSPDDSELHSRPRSYFEAHHGQVRTSNCTLADMNLPSAEDLLDALVKAKDPLQNELCTTLKGQTNDWRLQQLIFQLYASHSLLFYGFGSKRPVLNALAKRLASCHDVVSVQGYHPSVSIRAALSKITDEILHISSSFPKRSLLDYVNAIRSHIGNCTLAFIIHNIDGPSIRNSEIQYALAQLSAIPGILFAASVDHVNAPLLWNASTYATFAWAWINMHTFQPYDTETVYSSKPMLQGSGERRVDAAVILLKSLSVNARRVFRALADCQFGTGTDDPTAQKDHQETTPSARVAPVKRITVNALFERCRREFLVTDTASLNSILTELSTHEMLERRRGADAAEQLSIPLSSVQIKSVLAQISDDQM